MSDLVKPRDLSPDRLPWEKQVWETFPAFEAFVIYRDMGLARSITKAAHAKNETLTGTTKHATIRTRFGLWSGRHRWVERADAYDLHVDARMREQREGEIGKTHRRHAAMASRIDTALLESLRDTEKLALLANELDLEARVRAIAGVQKIELIALGQAAGEMGRGAFGVNADDAKRVFRDLFEIALPFIPADRQPLYAQTIQAYMATGQRPS